MRMFRGGIYKRLNYFDIDFYKKWYMREYEISDFHMIQLTKPYQVSNIWTIFTQRSPQPSEGEIDIEVEENK